MFRAELKEKLESIFGMTGKVTYSSPSDSFEQNTLFVEVEEARSRITENRETARVTGSLVVYAQQNRIPFGFFSKKIELADVDLKKNLFFFEIDREPANSPARLQNLVERRTSFLFLYDHEYNPNSKDLTSVEFGDDEDEE